MLSAAAGLCPIYNADITVDCYISHAVPSQMSSHIMMEIRSTMLVFWLIFNVSEPYPFITKV